MEIRFLILEVECHVKFKIDLIVWKFSSDVASGLVKVGLK